MKKLNLTSFFLSSDEQERIQRKTFINWINSYLSKRVPPMRVDNLIDDLKDGVKLLALLEVRTNNFRAFFLFWTPNFKCQINILSFRPKMAFKPYNLVNKNCW